MYVARDGSAKAWTQRDGRGEGGDTVALGEEDRDATVQISDGRHNTGTLRYCTGEGTAQYGVMGVTVL